MKDHRNQSKVAQSIAQQMMDPNSTTAPFICGVMIESHLVEGRQNISDAKGPLGEGLVYGKSITDACVDWKSTVTILDGLRQAVQARRAHFPCDNSIVDFA